jgi:hypothetical protein
MAAPPAARCRGCAEGKIEGAREASASAQKRCEVLIAPRLSCNPLHNLHIIRERKALSPGQSQRRARCQPADAGPRSLTLLLLAAQDCSLRTPGFCLPGGKQKRWCAACAVAHDGAVSRGPGRIVASHHRSSTSHQTRDHIRRLCF